MIIEITTPFHLTLDGIIHTFDAGVHDVHEKTAAHWFVKAMSKPVTPPVQSRTAAKKPEPDA